MQQSLIQCPDCRFIAVKFLLFKENGFIHEPFPGRTLKKIGISRLDIFVIYIFYVSSTAKSFDEQNHFYLQPYLHQV